MTIANKLFFIAKVIEGQYNDPTYDLPGGVEDIYSPSVPYKPRVDMVKKIVEIKPSEIKPVVNDLTPLKDLSKETQSLDGLNTYVLTRTDDED